MIFDTDILVWRLRDHPLAVSAINQVPPQERNVSVISCLELLYGCRNSNEFRLLKTSLVEHFAEIIPATEDISKSALRIMETYVLARRPDPLDILIAATALARNEPLMTANRKHFEFIPGLEVIVFRP